ncbi:lipid-A-disaccharide synthase N-terminal domain-containing protein [Candidatus Micrarchaeota archaeon]|nr:lipid-A-disaccharide synthase N-terminal domain-containing protein [Candidatus Micrarchaeota archaeon]
MSFLWSGVIGMAFLALAWFVQSKKTIDSKKSEVNLWFSICTIIGGLLTLNFAVIQDDLVFAVFSILVAASALIEAHSKLIHKENTVLANRGKKGKSRLLSLGLGVILTKAWVGFLGLAFFAFGWVIQITETIKARRSKLELYFSVFSLIGSAFLAIYSFEIIFGSDVREYVFPAIALICGIGSAIELKYKLNSAKVN